jgi:hypothetical protein
MKQKNSKGNYFQGIDISKIDNAADEKYFTEKGIDINKEIENLREKVNTLKIIHEKDKPASSLNGFCRGAQLEASGTVRFIACKMDSFNVSDNHEIYGPVNVIWDPLLDGKIREDSVKYKIALKTPKKSEISENDKNYLLEVGSTLFNKS